MFSERFGKPIVMTDHARGRMVTRAISEALLRDIIDTGEVRGVWIMKTIYYPQDDILEIHLSDKPVAREVSQDWNVNVSYAEDGTVVELVILDAVKAGFMPFQGGDRQAA